MVKCKDPGASAVAVDLFSKSLFPDGFNENSLWLGIYQTLMWAEKAPQVEPGFLLHIIDADKLRPAQGRDPEHRRSSFVWSERAIKVANYYTENLGIPVIDLKKHIGRLWRHPRWKTCQKQNPLGIGFVGIITHCLRSFVSSEWKFEVEQYARSVFPAISMVGRSKEPQMDILGIKNGTPRAIISCKWSVRHDRLGDVSSECTVYKSEALKNRIPFSYFLVTNEYDPARLDKALGDTCLDGVVHVHKKAVVDVCGLNGRLSKLLDLSDFFSALENLP